MHICLLLAYPRPRSEEQRGTGAKFHSNHLPWPVLCRPGRGMCGWRNACICFCPWWPSKWCNPSSSFKSLVLRVRCTKPGGCLQPAPRAPIYPVAFQGGLTLEPLHSDVFRAGVSREDVLREAGGMCCIWLCPVWPLDAHGCQAWSFQGLMGWQLHDGPWDSEQFTRSLPQCNFDGHQQTSHSALQLTAHGEINEITMNNTLKIY